MERKRIIDINDRKIKYLNVFKWKMLKKLKDEANLEYQDALIDRKRYFTWVKKILLFQKIKEVYEVFKARKSMIEQAIKERKASKLLGRAFKRRMMNTAPQVIQKREQHLKLKDKRKAAHMIVITQETLSYAAAAIRDAILSKAVTESSKFMKIVADKESTRMALLNFHKRFHLLSAKIEEFASKQK